MTTKIGDAKKNIQDKMIREHLNHGVGDLQVKIFFDGSISIRHQDGGKYGELSDEWQKLDETRDFYINRIQKWEDENINHKGKGMKF